MDQRSQDFVRVLSRRSKKSNVRYFETNLFFWSKNDQKSDILSIFKLYFRKNLKRIIKKSTPQ